MGTLPWMLIILAALILLSFLAVRGFRCSWFCMLCLLVPAGLQALSVVLWLAGLTPDAAFERFPDRAGAILLAPDHVGTLEGVALLSMPAGLVMALVYRIVLGLLKSKRFADCRTAWRNLAVVLAIAIWPFFAYFLVLSWWCYSTHGVSPADGTTVSYVQVTAGHLICEDVQGVTVVRRPGEWFCRLAAPVKVAYADHCGVKESKFRWLDNGKRFQFLMNIRGSDDYGWVIVADYDLNATRSLMKSEYRQLETQPSTSH